MNKEKYIYILPIFIFVLAMVIFPVVFFHGVMFFEYHFARPISWAGLDNFFKVLYDKEFWLSLNVSLNFIIFSVIIEFIVGLSIALALNNINKGKGIFRTLFIVPLAIAPIAVGLIWRGLLQASFGVIPYYLDLLGIRSIDAPFLSDRNLALFSIILADIWQNTSFIALVLEAGLTAVPLEQLESSKIDGASRVQTFRYITFPNLRPFIIIALVFRIMDAFKEYDKVFIMTSGGPAGLTQTIVFYIYKMTYVYLDIGAGAVMSFFVLWIVQILTIIFIRFRKI